MRTRLLLAALLGLALGCNQAAPPTGKPGGKQVVAMDSVPPVVLKAAQAERPEVNFDKVIKANGFYEVQGRNKAGKVIEVEVSEDGKVLQVEE
jgi:hypothetical protein